MMTEQNQELELAKKLIDETGQNIFLTGKAGTGKTTFLKRISSESPKRTVVLAPTGIAAINAGGMTIHSFFQLPFAPFIPGSAFSSKETRYRYQFSREKVNIIRSIDLLVIDEISMVRADLLDSVDDILRRYRKKDRPFGGVQLLLIGDMQQLPPVSKAEEWEILSQYYETPYFFSSHALKESSFVTVELQTVYRQKDSCFLELLNNIREKRNIGETLRQLNTRYRPDIANDDTGYIRLTTHNSTAKAINEEKLSMIDAESHRFEATVSGDFPESSYPTETTLELKAGAQVMFIKNDISGKHRYANGSIGHVESVSEDGITVILESTGESVEVEKAEWTNARYRLDESTHEIVEEIEGTFSQYPLKLAWAITIHKSQGLTFEQAIIDASAAFAHGQTYVALSRCKSLEGLVLDAPLTTSSLILDPAVNSFSMECRERIPDNEAVSAMQKAFFTDQLQDLFDFEETVRLLRRYTYLIKDNVADTYPKLLEALKSECLHAEEAVSDVSSKFKVQYMRLAGESADYREDRVLKDRIRSAAIYFLEQMGHISTTLSNADIDTDNKTAKKQLSTVMHDLKLETSKKSGLLEHIINEGFSIREYMRKKALLSIDPGPESKSTKRKSQSDKIQDIPSDIINKDLYDSLVKWRREEATRLNLPAYTILHQKAILGISNTVPGSHAELLKVPCVGEKTVKKYGDKILDIIRSGRRKSQER